VHQAIELHDSTIQAIRADGPDLVIEMTVYVHESAGVPGRDPGVGWFQPAQMFVSNVVLDAGLPPVPLRLDDGVVGADGERLENIVRLPLDCSGQVTVELRGLRGAIAARGSRVRVNLEGTPGTVERFPGAV
jgi:hypothetical protein